MQTAFQTPTAAQVKAACARFDQEHSLSEETLAELFQQFPSNEDLRHVLLKVVAVNSLYHSCIHAVEAVARHIHSHADAIDAALRDGSPDAVDLIANITHEGKRHNFFSFATKYCSWHDPEKYPIYDTRIDSYLWTMHNQIPFGGFNHPELWNYSKFCRIMTAFRDSLGLQEFSFKELDKFIYLECEPLPARPEEPHSGPGAFDFFPGEQQA